jgi:AcrR family transcriptional regulator
MAHDVRERLVSAAFELFAERGYEQTTVDDIAERAGVGRTTFFRTFRSKDDVIFPDHEQLLGAIEARLAASTAETSVVAVSDAARLVLRHYLVEGDRARHRYALTKSVPALRDRERAGIQQYTALFQRFLRRWMGDEPSRALRAELMANAVVTAHNHVLRRWLRGASEEPEAEFGTAISEVVDLFAEPREKAIVILRTGSDLADVLPRVQSVL